MTPEEAIAVRRSVRTFIDETPAPGVIEEVCRGKSCLAPIDASLIGSGRVGTYGVIKGRPAYIAVIAGDELKAGIEGEQAVIELTQRGLGTCWLGGTFDRKSVREALKLPDGRRVAAVIAAGTPAGHTRLTERIMRMAVGAGNRKTIGELTIAGTAPEYLQAALTALRLAPSACNRQPWRLAFNPGGSVDVYATPSDSFMLLDTGIAISHFLMLRPDYRLAPNNNPHPTLTPVATLKP